MTSPKPTLKRAFEGYDEEFRKHLASEIIKTIARESVVSDQNTIALRTAETAEALADVIGMMLTLNPNMSNPSALRETCKRLAKKLHRNVAKMRAEGVADIFGWVIAGACQRA